VGMRGTWNFQNIEWDETEFIFQYYNPTKYGLFESTDLNDVDKRWNVCIFSSR
jgi:hypothetical protein